MDPGFGKHLAGTRRMTRLFWPAKSAERMVKAADTNRGQLSGVEVPKVTCVRIEKYMNPTTLNCVAHPVYLDPKSM